MVAKPSMTTRLPEDDRGRTREDSSRVGALSSRIARIARIRQSLALADYEDAPANELDEVVAPWFRAAVEAWGKSTAYAARINVSESHLSEMLAGKRPVALRHLIPLHESQAAVKALVGPLCQHAGLDAPQSATRVTRDQVVAEFMRSLLESPPLLRLLVAEAARAFGVSADEVMAALAAK